MFLFRKSAEMPTRETALKGRETPIPTAERHFVNGRPLQGPYPEGWKRRSSASAASGARSASSGSSATASSSTAVGYAGGVTPNPTYEEVCSGRTGHNEVVLVVFDPKRISYEALLKTFWESHDPTQGMRQGNDVGTQYRSGIYVFDEAQRRAAEASKAAYGRGARRPRATAPITTEIADAGPFYFAEDYHQQYLAKNPSGYCGLGGTGVACPIGDGVAAE